VAARILGALHPDMTPRATPLLLCALLVAAAAGAAWAAWDFGRYLRAADRDSRAAGEALDRSAEAIDDIAAGQQAYLDAGDDLRPWLDQVSAALQQLYRDTAMLGATLRDERALDSLAGFEEALAAIVQTDTQIRERLRVDDLATARRLVAGDGTSHLDAARIRLAALREAESVEADSRAASLRWRMGGAAVLALLLAGFGIVQLRMPPQAAGDTVTPAARPPTPTEGGAGPATNGVATSSTVDLTALAEVCSGLSRVSSPQQVPGLLGRAAAALDASGLIVWLARGDRLAPVAAHGYDARALDRMGTVDRSARHATAMAWTTGTVQTVAADGSASSAIVTPLHAPGGCLGVLTVEVSPGAEVDPQRLAATGLLAAQLATLLAGSNAADRPSE
jgi:CHASE3 domain sensor protein